ncbi:MAG: CxxxxCH/CxxCH domain-containing protein [Candidatus Deferrimicrobiaceae bacterium]
MMAIGRIRPLWPVLISILLALFATGCSTSTENGGLSLVDEQGSHPANFLGTHPAFAVSSAAQCRPCHGNDLMGGIANTSCFTAACHHGTQTGWLVFPSGPPQGHGISAKKAPGSSGFASCQICHASDFTGGGAGVSCFLCHTPPHPDDWRSFDVYKHTDTDQANAPVCAQCHLNGNNSPIGPPSPPAPAGTSPGCFNNTLCHGANATPHALGSTWLTPNASFHGLTAKADLAFCQTCHGTPGTILFDGGAVPTACSACHLAADAHPTTWFEAPQTGFPPYTPSHRNAGSIATACAICHVVDGPGTGPNPAAPSCFSPSFTNSDGVAAACHASGPGVAPHAVPFLSHTYVTDATFNDPFPDGCASCHALTGTSPVSSAPACSTCHAGGSPLTLLSCTSCHADPPAGAAYPNVAGAHAVHLALDNTLSPVSCDTCHTGLGSGTQAHYDRAKAQVPPGDVAFVTTYDAQSGAPSFDNAALNLTCVNVSCHGGQTTPNWQTGTIDITSAADCLLCHAFGTGQFNSYSSGEHDFHVNESGFSCTFCHNTTSLAVSHFSALSTIAMEGPASDTVGGAGTGVISYIAPTCISACHSAPGRDW